MNPEEKRALMFAKVDLFLWGFMWCNALDMLLKLSAWDQSKVLWVLCFAWSVVLAKHFGRHVKGLSIKQ